jgi:membrane protein
LTGVDDHLARLERSIRRNRAGRRLLRLIDSLDRHGASLGAGAMAFDAFLSLVPLVAFLGYVAARLHENGELLVGPLARLAPGPVGDFVTNDLNRLADPGTFAIAPVSFVAFVWTSSAGISTAMGVVETMFASPPRRWIVRRGVAIGCVLGSIVLLGGLTVAAIAVGSAGGPLVTKGLAFALPPVVAVGMVAAFFRIAVRGHRPRRRVVPGAVATLVLWTVVSGLFSLYVAHFSRYVTLYGSLATAAIFLLWLWLLALLLLIGGEINATLEGIREDPPEEDA